MSSECLQILLTEHLFVEQLSRSLASQCKGRLSLLLLDAFLFFVFILGPDRVGIEVKLERIELVLDECLLRQRANLLHFLKAIHHAFVRVLNLIKTHFGWSGF